MDSLADLAEVVIGVDTHIETHTAAVIDTRTGGVLGELTVAVADFRNPAGSITEIPQLLSGVGALEMSL